MRIEIWMREGYGGQQFAREQGCRFSGPFDLGGIRVALQRGDWRIAYNTWSFLFRLNLKNNNKNNGECLNE